MIAEISKGSQITIPAQWRKSLGLAIGDKIDIEIEGKSLVISPLDDLSIDEVFAKVKKLKPHHISPAELKSMIDKEFYS